MPRIPDYVDARSGSEGEGSTSYPSISCDPRNGKIERSGLIDKRIVRAVTSYRPVGAGVWSRSDNQTGGPDKSEGRLCGKP